MEKAFVNLVIIFFLEMAFFCLPMITWRFFWQWLNSTEQMDTAMIKVWMNLQNTVVG